MSVQSEAVVRSLGLLFAEGTYAALDDNELLERFLTRPGEAAAHAFEGLVLRHGPMVYQVCQRILGDPHDAQDAFQATFLVLAARARSIRRQKSVGSWLHGVALRVARRARADAARRRAHERRAAEMNRRAVETTPDPDVHDFRALHEEVERLPRKYREPVILCYLEGVTIEAAAGRLGCPAGTIGVRLMRARERLRDRLGRRGASPAVGPPIAGPGPVVLPPSLVQSTVGAAARIAAGGTVPLASAPLAYGVLRSMAMVRRIQVIAASLAAMLGVASIGVAVGLAGPRGMEGPARPAPARAPESWIGKKAVIRWSAPLMDGDRVVADNAFRVYKVDQIEGDRIRLVSEDASGWIPAGEVVLLDEAIAFYTEVIRGNEKHTAARVKRAQVRNYLGDRAKAIAELTEAIEIGPPNAVVYSIRGRMFQDDEEYDKAIADLTEAVRLTPWAPAYFHRGQCWAAKGAYDKAIADYDESIKLDPNSGLTYLNRGLARALRDDFDEAIADFDEAIRLATKYDGAAYRCRGIARLDRASRDREKKAPEAAIADLDEAIRLDANDAVAYGQRSRARAWNGEYDEVIADADRAIRLDPRHQDAWVCRGIARIEREQYAQAIADLTEAIRLDGEDAMAYYHRGRARLCNKEHDAAIADFSESTRIDPEADAAYADRGGAWFDKGDYDKALRDFDEAIRLGWRSARTWLYRGLARSKKRDYDGAIADFDEVLKLNPEERAGVDPRGVYALINRGWARFKKREYDKAVADFDEAARIEPGNADLAYSRAWVWATCPDARFRDGKRAIEMAEDICKGREWKFPPFIDLLAAAYAEVGDFDAAVKWQAKANAIETDRETRAEGEARLALYRARKPYRDDRR